MGILDDAIKEHLELKRQHGADDYELKKLEDEAFGQSERPGEGSEGQDSLAEAPTEFLSTPGLAESVPPDAAPTEGDGLMDWEESDAGPRSARSEAFDLQEPPQPPAPSEPPEVAEEESPAMEHEALRPPDAAAEPEAPPAEPEAPPAEPEEAEPSPEEPQPEEPQPQSHSAAEREAISEQPTELFDVELEVGPSGGEDPFGGAASPEPAPPPSDPAQEDGPDDFFDDKRLSDELDEALDAPVEDDSERGDFDEAEDSSEEEPRSESLGGAEESDADGDDTSPYDSERGEDVLEETPDFLEEAPEDDRLWFEQKPPKDFDFDD